MTQPLYDKFHVPYICNTVTVHTGSSGSVTFENVPRRGERNGPYSLRAVAVNADGLRTVIRTSVRPGELTVWVNRDMKI